jgi:hypothetical protein
MKLCRHPVFDARRSGCKVPPEKPQAAGFARHSATRLPHRFGKSNRLFLPAIETGPTIRVGRRD